MTIASELKSVKIGHGLRERLLLAFIAISGFAVVAAVVGNYAFYAIGQSLRQVTEKSVPSAIASLELAQRAERIIAAGPALLGAANSEDFRTATALLDREVQAAGRQLSELPGQGLTADQLIQIRLIFRVVTDNLNSLKSAVQARIAATDRKAALVRDAFEAYNQFRTLWTPKFNELKGHILALQRALNNPSSAPEESSRPSIASTRRSATSRRSSRFSRRRRSRSRLLSTPAAPLRRPSSIRLGLQPKRRFGASTIWCRASIPMFRSR